MSKTPADITHLSHSSVATFLRCPRQWAYSYLEGLRRPPAGVLIKGRAVDDGLSKNFEQKIRTRRDMPVDDVLEVAEQSFRREVSREGGQSEVDWEGSNFAAALDSTIALTNVHMHEHSPYIQPIAVQEELHRSLPDGRDFMGFIDFVSEDGKVNDWKTGRSKMSQESADSDLQPSAYAFLKGGPIEFAFYRAVDTGRSRSSQVVETSRSAQQVAWYESAATDVSAAINSGAYPPNPNGWHCSPKFCGYYQLCMSGRKPAI